VKRLSWLMAAGVLCSTGIARAQATPSAVEPPEYFNVRLGLFKPTANDLDGYGAGLAGEVAFGAFFNRYVAAEVGLGHYRTSDSQEFWDPTYGLYTVESVLSMIPITTSVKLVAPLSRIDLYGLVGVGMYFLGVEVTESASGTSATDDDIAFGFHLGGGFALPISQQFDVGAEVRWARVEPTFDGGRFKADGVRFQGVLAYRF
jgi:hypothetical protein